MCGIVGYIGNEDVKETILKGLERLEYRGYDSAGIALLDGDEVKVFKDKGRIAHLRDIINYDVKSTVGIGHTRWATHGKPNKINSHPHQSSCRRFTIVHNGIIENEEFLKNKYLENIEFESETDTEIIAQLLNKFTEEGEDVSLAIRHLMSEIEGSYALAILDQNDKEKIYAAKNKSPLLVGKGNNFNMVGSDAMAMINHTNQFYELNDGEYVEISKNNVEIFNIYGVKSIRDTYTAEMDSDDIEKGTYPHYMLKEIDEQPFVIRRIIAEYQGENGNLKIDENIIEEINRSDRIYIIACGTSYHAGLVGKYYFENISDKPA